ADEDVAGKPAETALVRLGEETIPAVGAFLGDPRTPREAAKAAVRVLRRIGTTRALGCLLEHIEHADERVRRKVLRGAALLYDQLGRPQVLPPPVMEARLVAELRRAYQIASDEQSVLAAYPGKILQDTFEVDLHRSIHRVFSLLRLMADPDLIRRVRASLRHGTHAEKANALEVLENSVSDGLKRPLVGLLEERAGIGSRSSDDPMVEAVPTPPDRWLASNFEGGGGWHRVAAFDCVGFHRITAFEPQVRAALADPVPLVREVAAWSLARLLGPAAAPDLAKLENDPRPGTRRVISYLQERYVNGSSHEGNDSGATIMLTTLEEVLFLRHVPLLQGVSAEDLAVLAEATRETFAAPGDVIVQQGESAGALYIIMKGSVSVEVDLRRIVVLGQTEFFGEMALLDRGVRSATVRSLEPTELLVLSADEFNEYLEERPEVAKNVLRILCQRLRAMNQKLALSEATEFLGPGSHND
ncbi:MAG: cyclic nucleotide-binding domain-containing protein, partial [Candidatus Riflebacteria bacterium]|nr:cyclic nucleotide-binding domain-containing protein [Candidatus Riflebacteria bacterium]